LSVRTARLDDVGDLLSLLPDDGELAWVRRGEGLVGWGSAARLDLSGPERFADAENWWREVTAHVVVRDELQLGGTGLVAFGSFAFDDEPGSSVLVVPEVVVGRRGNVSWVTTVGVDGSLPPNADLPEPSPVRPPTELAFADGACSGTEWERVVADAVGRIAAGKLEKVVLARELEAVAREPVDLRWPLRRLAAGYPGCWTFAVDGLLGATPEMLVRLERGLVTSRVLAGTIRRSGDDARDLALAASLAHSSKDLEEHEYAVRSVADALAPHCSSMNVPETPFVLHLPNVMHLATDVTGVATDGSSALSLAAALHPSAAVCGTPTDVARELIREVEGMDRGRYAGPVGWMNAFGDGEWGIALRCAEVDPTDPARLRLFAGCGIVAGSEPEAELAESAAKLVPMRDALQRD
jgi:menaquinone-specific isochorismate synthase